MIKLIIVGRRRAGATRAQALHHLKTVHGPLVFDAPADAGPMPAAYAQNHVFDGVHRGGSDLMSPYAIERDFVTEIWFQDFDALGAATSTPYYKTRLQPDEDRFVDQVTVAPGVFVATPRRNMAAGQYKLFLFLKAANGTDVNATTTVAAEVLQEISADPAVRDAVLNTALPRPDAEPFTHAVLELWFADRQAAVGFAAIPLDDLLARFPSGTLDPTACFHLLAEELTIEQLRAACAAT